MFEYTHFNIAPWGHELVLYFWIIGAIAMTYILASVPALTTGTQEALAKVQKPAYGLSFLALLVCGVILITDLGQPGRFMNILIYHHMSSALVWGSILLLGFGACMVVALYATFIKKDDNLLRWAALLGSILAVGFPLYTGLDLAAAQGRVFWSDASVPVLFVALSASSGAGVVALLGLLTGDGGNKALFTILRRVLFWASLATLAIFVLMYVNLNYGNAQEMQVYAMLNGEFSTEYWVGAFLVGIIVPLVLTGIPGLRDSAALVTVAGICALVGAYAYRAIIMYAGQLPQLYY